MRTWGARFVLRGTLVAVTATLAAGGRFFNKMLVGPGDPEDFFYRGTRAPNGRRSGGDQGAIIDTMQIQGGNTLYLQAVRTHRGDGACDHNPFLSSDPANSIDPDIINQWHRWLSEADNSGIVTHFFLYDDSSCPWGGSSTNCNILISACKARTTLQSDERAFITTIVNKFKGRDNII